MVDPNIKKKADDIRNKIYGKEVRESLASGLEEMSSDVVETVGRQDEVEGQFQDVIENTTDKDVISAPEIIAARNGESNLKARLDKEKNEVAAQLAQTAKLQKYTRNAERPLNVPTYDGSYQTVHPHVLYFANGWKGYRYWMAHTPYPNTNDVYENPSISVSHDGVQWFDPPGIVNPIDIPTPEQLADDYHMSDTHLVYRPDTDTLECWYRINKNGVIDQILRKTSSDGISWTPREVVHEVSGTLMTMSPAIIWDGTKYKMWYVANEGVMSVVYRESPTALNGTWSTKQICVLNYKANEPEVLPWHIDVSYSDNKYFIALNAIKDYGLPTSTRVLLVGESTDGMTFNELNTILSPTPSNNTTNWDNIEIYRSCFVKVGTTYRLYYSAYGNASGWRIGLLVGDTPQTVNRIDVTRDPSGNTINLNSIVMKKGDALYTQETKGSYLNSEQLKFLITNVAGASLKLMPNGQIEVLDDVGARGALNANELSADLSVTTKQILGVSSYNGGYPTAIGKFALMGVNGEKVHLKFADVGFGGAGLALGSQADTLRVVNDENTSKALLEMSGLLLSPGTIVPNIAGAIRYNTSTKKHEGYDGTTWNPFY